MDVTIYQTLRNTPIRSQDLATILGQIELGRQYKSPSSKLTFLEQSGKIIRLKRGLYMLDGSAYGFPPSGPIASNHIYGPSYLSCHWALSHYGLLPERVHTWTAVTLKHARQFDNVLGHFTYRQVPRSYYPIGITTDIADGAVYRIATPEKALADMLVCDTYVPYESQKGLWRYLEEDIRFDMEALRQFDVNVLSACAEAGLKQSTFTNLMKIIQQL